MAHSLVLSLDVCPRLGISPLRTNIWLSFSQADLGPRSAQELFFSGFLKSLKRIFSEICADSERYRNLLAGIFQILTFCGNIVFPLSPVSLSKTAWTLASEGILGLMLEPACTLFSQTWKKAYFLPSERDREILSPVFCTAAPKCVCIRRLAGARHVSPAVL